MVTMASSSTHLQNQNSWTTGADAMTERQAEYLRALCSQHDKFFNSALTKTEASQQIDELKSHPPNSCGNPTASASSPDRKAAAGTDAAASVAEIEGMREATKTPPPESHLAKPATWTTGEEPATERQRAYLAVLDKRAGGEGGASGSDMGEGLSKSKASEEIERLKRATRG